MEIDEQLGISVDILQELKDDLIEGSDNTNNLLIRLEANPEDEEGISALFRAAHTLKGNLSVVNLDKYIPTLQAIEDVLARVRSKNIKLTRSIIDMLLLAFDYCFNNIHMRLEGTLVFDETRDDAIAKGIAVIARMQDEHRHKQTLAVIRMLDPNFSVDNIPDPEMDREKVQQLVSSFGVEGNEDLEFFSRLAAPLESRSSYWPGRLERIARMSLAMNAQAGEKVDPQQLLAACYLHDIGMSFMPLDLIHKPEAYSKEEKALIHSHVRMGYELLRRLAKWQGAAEMVLHHHEKMDGSGYPKGLTENEICDGAKILAIADTYEACTHERSYQKLVKRPIIRAVMEINQNSGDQFSEFWVEQFNKAVKMLIAAS